MKQLKIMGMMMLMVMAMPLMVACGSDDDDVNTINKSELIGTWYTLQDDWVIVFNNTSVTQYELWVQGGVYSLNPYTYTWNYTISGNKLISDDGQEAQLQNTARWNRCLEGTASCGMSITSMTHMSSRRQQAVSHSMPFIRRYAKWGFPVVLLRSMITTNIFLTGIEVTGPRIGNHAQRKKNRRMTDQNCFQ